MGLTARTLVIITAYQYGLVDGEKLRAFFDDFFFPEAMRRLVMNAVLNNYINMLLHNHIIQQFINNSEELKKLVDEFGTHAPRYLEKVELENARTLEGLFMDVLKAEKSGDLSEKILVADKLIHYQHVTGNFLEEDVEEEYFFADRIIEKLLQP